MEEIKSKSFTSYQIFKAILSIIMVGILYLFYRSIDIFLKKLITQIQIVTNEDVQKFMNSFIELNDLIEEEINEKSEPLNDAIYNTNEAMLHIQNTALGVSSRR